MSECECTATDMHDRGCPAVLPAEPTVEGRLAELDALRATVARVRALIAFYDRHEYASLNVDDLRSALAGD